MARGKKMSRGKKIAAGVGAVGLAGAAYGGRKLHKAVKGLGGYKATYQGLKGASAYRKMARTGTDAAKSIARAGGRKRLARFRRKSIKIGKLSK